MVTMETLYALIITDSNADTYLVYVQSFTEGAGEGITQKRNFPGEAEAGDGNVSITRPSVNESGDAPVKRKRGRPPKYKPQAPEGQNITITPKQLSPPAKGRRGRPPKKQIVHEEDQANSGHGDQEKEEVVQRRRGSSPASEDVKEIPDENELSDAHGDGLLVKVRISRRLAKKVKRIFSYVAKYGER